MPEDTRIPKPTSVSQVSKQKEQSRSSQEQHGEQQGKAAHVPETAKNVSERRTRSISQEPVEPSEEAMDIAIAGEGKPWVQRKRNVSERRTRSISQGPVEPSEEAMDIAVGGEGKPWVQRKKEA